MNKTKELLTTKGLVKAILTDFPQTRNSDSLLYLKILKILGAEKEIDIENISITTFLLEMAKHGFPCFESVRRTRQKLQAEYPELKPNITVQSYREENEAAYRRFARSRA